MTASTRSYFGPLVLADEVGLARWQFERAEAPPECCPHRDTLAAGCLSSSTRCARWCP
jgi:hypothetical protein